MDNNGKVFPGISQVATNLLSSRLWLRTVEALMAICRRHVTVQTGWDTLGSATPQLRNLPWILFTLLVSYRVNSLIQGYQALESRYSRLPLKHGIFISPVQTGMRCKHYGELGTNTSHSLRIQHASEESAGQYSLIGL